MYWRAPAGPPEAAWIGSVKKWRAAEETTLRDEEVKGIRKHPISMEWAQLLFQFTQETTHEDTLRLRHPNPKLHPCPQWRE